MENNFESRTAEIRYPGPAAAGLLFSIATILLTYGGSLLPFKNSFLRSGLGEIGFVLLPVIIFLTVGRYNIKQTLKLKKTRPINYLVIVFLVMFGMPVAGILNAIVLGIIRLVFGRNLPIPQIDIPNAPTLFIAVLVIGVSAAVCEETMFRGLISKGYERFGTVASLVLTSILFGILHRDIQKGVSTILLGALIGFIVYRTQSIYSGMVAHFTNNSVAVLLTYASSKMTSRLNKIGSDPFEGLYLSSIPTASLVIVIIFYAIIFAGFIAGFVGLLYAFHKTTEKDVRERALMAQTAAQTAQDPNETVYVQQGKEKPNAVAILCLLPGLLLILLTFTGQFLKLMDINSGFLYNFLRALRLG